MKAAKAKGRNEMLPGTLEMLILQTLTLQPLHGYAIAQQIQRLSDGALIVEQGSLYPALERLLQNGWVTAKWGESPTGRRARYYTITASGRRRTLSSSGFSLASPPYTASVRSAASSTPHANVVGRKTYRGARRSSSSSRSSLRADSGMYSTR